MAYIISYTDGTVRPRAISPTTRWPIFFRLLTDGLGRPVGSEQSILRGSALNNNAISTLTSMGILDGYPDGTFRPTEPITRSEFTKIAVSFFEFTEGDLTYDGRFSDVEGTEWYVTFLAAAVEYGLIEGMPDGTFHPLDNITRAEACTIVNRTLGRAPHEAHLLPRGEMLTWPDNNTSAWYYAAMQEATNSHDYIWTEGEDTEEWTGRLTERDWAALERVWSDAHDAPGGEVMD
ncbi:MAG: S-layer homology domain-containing protein [Flavonifractor plautii]